MILGIHDTYKFILLAKTTSPWQEVSPVRAEFLDYFMHIAASLDAVFAMQAIPAQWHGIQEDVIQFIDIDLQVYFCCSNTLATQCRVDSLEKTLMLGKIEDKRRRGQQRRRWLDSNSDSMDMNLRRLWDIVKNREVWHAAVHRVTKSRT